MAFLGKKPQILYIVLPYYQEFIIYINIMNSWYYMIILLYYLIILVAKEFLVFKMYYYFSSGFANLFYYYCNNKKNCNVMYYQSMELFTGLML